MSRRRSTADIAYPPVRRRRVAVGGVLAVLAMGWMAAAPRATSVQAADGISVDQSPVRLQQPESTQPQLDGGSTGTSGAPFSLQQPGFIYPAGERPVRIVPAAPQAVKSQAAIHPATSDGQPPSQSPAATATSYSPPAAPNVEPRMSSAAPPFRAAAPSLAEQLLGKTSQTTASAGRPGDPSRASSNAVAQPAKPLSDVQEAVAKQATGLAAQLFPGELPAPSSDVRTVQRPIETRTAPGLKQRPSLEASHGSSSSLWTGLIEQVAPRAKTVTATDAKLPGQDDSRVADDVAPAMQPEPRKSPQASSRWAGLLTQIAPGGTPDDTASPPQATTRAPSIATAATSPAVQSSPLSAPSAHTAQAAPPGTIAPPNLAALAGAAGGGKSAVSALWRPLAMNQDGIAPAATLSEQNLPTTPKTGAGPKGLGIAQAGTSLDQRLENSLLFRPFYMTDIDTSASRDGALASVNATTTQSAARNWNDTLRASPLMRQLSLSTDEQLTAPLHSLADSALQSEHAAWEQDWTLLFPSVTNPLTMTNEPSAPAATASATSDVQQVAFLQEAAPEPDDLDLNAENGVAAPVAPGAENGTDGEEADSLAEAEEIGEEPEDTTLQFLRTATVLLEPGESQVDVAITYLFSENDLPVLLADDMGNIVGVDEVSFRVRELAVPVEYRVGLLKRVQGFIGASVGWSNTELSLDSFEAFDNDGGFGDVNFGLTMQLVDSTANSPYWIATIQATAPTGGDPFSGAVGLAPSAPSLGQGFWSIAGNLLFIQPYDPVVVFYGLGTEHFFSREFRGIEIEPGAQYNYTFGVGFAINERVTLSGRFFGAYVEELKADGQRLFNSNIEPMTMRFSATISKPCDRIVEPFVEFGLTDDSVSSFIGCTWTY